MEREGDWLWKHLRAIDRAASSTIGMNAVRDALDALNDDCGNCLERRSQQWMDTVFSGTPRDLRGDNEDRHLWAYIDRINAFAADDHGLGKVRDELDEISRISAGRLREDD